MKRVNKVTTQYSYNHKKSQNYFGIQLFYTIVVYLLHIERYYYLYFSNQTYLVYFW